MNTTGNLDRRIVIERCAEGLPNELGDTQKAWSTLATVWAARRDVSDGEKVAAAQVGGILQARFVIRSSAVTRTITPVDRLSYDGSYWNIEGIKQTQDGRDRYLEVTAARKAD